jgi:hypothetical protein
MHASLYLTTDLFEHREARPNRAHPGCFGEDFAAWLLHRLTPDRLPGFELSEPMQEDYGWGLWVTAPNRDTFWVALAYGDETQAGGATEWVVSVAYDPGLSLLRRLFHRPDPAVFGQLRRVVWDTLHSAPGIVVRARE